MASDRARITFDETRNYRSVVAQQGRVTLEADVNEAAMIAGEALRLETIDVVGPAGTPNDGYAVVVNKAGNGLVVEAGTMYAGGWRLRLDEAVDLDNQPDWVDQPAPAAASGTTTSLVALLAIEQSITAVEDQELREVALGGPDTAARTRLMQHFIEVPTTRNTCDAAAADLTKTLAAEGLIFHPKSLEITFDAALQVSFFPPAPPADPCCPPAQGGYLGSDNQLVRVTVTQYNAQTKTGTLLWGWNNASFLYRASLVDAKANPQILTLTPPPIDSEHTPQPGQVIEVLRTTCVLSDKDKDYIAALQGDVIQLGSSAVFDLTSNQLTLPGQPLAGGYLTDTDPLFVRLWQAEVQFTAGQAAQLDSVSGLAVTVYISALPSAPFDARPYWHFAVRPNTPQQVYPQGYLEKHQGADGPRQWLCDLALVQTTANPAANSGSTVKVLADCRVKFLPLTELDACDCCNMALDPSENWQVKLNAVLIDKAIKSISICFQPGIFRVTNTITFSGKLVKIIGAGAGTSILGKPLEVVMEFDNCPSVTLSDLAVEAGNAGYDPNNGTQHLQGAVTLRDCTQIDIERVTLRCASADMRSASCLYVINSLAAAGKSQTPTNVRILNSQFEVGDCQVGILLVNADRAQVEGNLILTPMVSLNVKSSDLAGRAALANRLEKLLVHGLTLVDTAAPTKKAKRLLKRQIAAAKKAPAATTPGGAPEAAPPAAPAEAAASAPAQQEIVIGSASVPAPPATVSKVAEVLPKINLGAIGRAHVTANFGTVKLQFLSSDTLTNTWSNAIKASTLTPTSTMRQIHDMVRSLAAAASRGQVGVAHGFSNYIDLVLPQLYSTASQGIVVGGNFANDIRILDNTIDGTVQGIHVGLGDGNANPAAYHLKARQVQIRGNTVTVRITPTATGGRHGIFLGCVTSALISDNNIMLLRTQEGSFDTDAIRVVGLLGPRVLIEGNSIDGTFTQGIYVQPSRNDNPQPSVWKAADNYSLAHNSLPGFIQTDNNLS